MHIIQLHVYVDVLGGRGMSLWFLSVSLILKKAMLIYNTCIVVSTFYCT